MPPRRQHRIIAKGSSGGKGAGTNGDAAKTLTPTMVRPRSTPKGQFVFVICKRIKLEAKKAIFIFVNNVLPPTIALMSSIYKEHKDQDGFLYVTYSGEKTFGFL
ncbi:hypothetical protein L7F22_027352 [Adiantum nelumboides]|nr:hypothetical protein [Adiantum nelumboides]